MTRDFDQLDLLVHYLARAREHIRKEWEVGLLDGAEIIWEDEAFFPANEALVNAIVEVIHARDNEQVKSS